MELRKAASKEKECYDAVFSNSDDEDDATRSKLGYIAIRNACNLTDSFDQYTEISKHLNETCSSLIKGLPVFLREKLENKYLKNIQLKWAKGFVASCRKIREIVNTKMLSQKKVI